jgi:hypothetical protein
MLGRLKEWFVLNAQRRRISRQFAANMGYAGDFENPRTHQEKMQFRKLYGNHAFYALAADKYRVRDYVASKVGAEHLIPLLGAYSRLDESLFEALPQQFVIKANHGCKWNEIVFDKSKLDIPRTVRRFNKLCNKRYGWSAGERHYNFIPPMIVIEELLRGEDGGVPWDYSFFCYRAPGRFDYTIGIGSPDGRSAGFDSDWTPLAGKIPADELARHLRPPNFDVMVQMAKDLSADFDFVRVDLYNVRGRIYFGELTCTPHQGYGIIENKVRQKICDELWRLDSGNPLLYIPPKSHRSGG